MQGQVENVNVGTLADSVSTVVPSARLLELCREYLALVDHGTPEQQGAERTRAHNALIQQMVAEGIVPPSPHRVLVRWLARYFVQTEFLAQNKLASALAHVPHTQIMFLRRDSFPPQLEMLPPFYEQEEKSALAFYIPVRVTIEPLLEPGAHVESDRQHKLKSHDVMLRNEASLTVT